MSSKVKSLEDALQKRQEKRKAQEAQEAQVSQFSIEGEEPVRFPRAGETVEFTWADPAMIGAPALQLGFFVSQALKRSKDGRINGWVLMDPTMQMADAHGRPVQVPPLVPVANTAYSKERKPMTWRYFADAEEPETPQPKSSLEV